jgi:hypothetical protein
LQKLKKKKKMYKDGTDFNLVFAGRMTGTRNFQGVLKLFRKHFAYPLGKNKKHVKFIVSTQSTSTGASKIGDMSFINILKNDREAFHTFLKKKAHLIVNLSSVEDFSLSTYEPMHYGVPVIVAARPWSEFLGPNYPFRVKSENEAYALIKAFIEDYDKCYQLFLDWQESYWVDFIKSEANTSTVELVVSLVTKMHRELHDETIASGVGGRFVGGCDEIVAKNKPRINVIDELIEVGCFIMPKTWTMVPMAQRPSLLLAKMLLKERGYRDTNDIGVLELKEPLVEAVS